MPVFDGQNKVPTRRNLAGDSFSPNMGSLTGSGYTEDTKINGTLNQLVTGEITRFFVSKEWVTITADRNESIAGTWYHTVQTETVMVCIGSTTVTRLGQLTQVYVTGENTLCVGPFNRTDVASCTWLCPTSTQINSGDLFETKINKSGAYAFRLTMVGIDTTVRMAKTDMSVNTVNTKPIETRLQNLQSHLLGGLKTAATAAAIAVEMARSDINGIHPEVRALRPAVGVEVSAPPTSLPGVQ